MPILYMPECMWICVAVGMLAHGVFLFRGITDRPMLKRWFGLPLLLPAGGGLALARLGYLLLQPGENMSTFHWCFTTGLYGMILGTAVSAWMIGMPARQLLDRTAPGLCLAMAAARLGQRWLGEVGFGPWLEEDSWMSRSHLAMRNEWGEAVTGIFWMEAFTALMAALAALWVLRKMRAWKIPSDPRTDPMTGSGAALSVSLLVIPQIFWEQLRTGHCMYWWMVRSEQILCAIPVLLALVFLCQSYRREIRTTLAEAWWPLGMFVLLAAVIVVTEFVLDGKWMTWPEPVCWLVYLAAIIGLLALVEFCTRRLWAERIQAERWYAMTIRWMGE